MGVYEVGWQRHVRFAAEETWGEVPGGPTYYFLPYLSYGLKANPEFEQAELFTGVRQERHNRLTRIPVNGAIECPLFATQAGSPKKSLAERFIAAAISAPAGIELDSLMFERWGANERVRHTAARINQLTLSGEAGSRINMNADMIAQQEVAGIGDWSIDQTAPLPQEFLFADCQMWFGQSGESSSSSSGSQEVKIQNFNLTIANNLIFEFANGKFIELLLAGVRKVSYSFTVFKKDAFYDNLRRSTAPNEYDLHLRLKGNHLGTGSSGTYTTIDIFFDRMSMNSNEETAGRNETVKINAGWNVLKPNTANDEIRVVFSNT